MSLQLFLSLSIFEHVSLHLFCPLLGVLPASTPIFPFPPSPTDCVEAHRVCSADLRCEALYRGLDLCAADAAVSPLGEQVAAECLERQDALLAKHPALLSCKCQRGFRKEEQCLRIYWRVRLLPGQSGLCRGRVVRHMHANLFVGCTCKDGSPSVHSLSTLRANHKWLLFKG